MARGAYENRPAVCDGYKLDVSCEESAYQSGNENRNSDCVLCIDLNHGSCSLGSWGILLPCPVVRRKCLCRSKPHSKPEIFATKPESTICWEKQGFLVYLGLSYSVGCRNPNKDARRLTFMLGVGTPEPDNQGVYTHRELLAPWVPDFK